jgi:hypothetical protein
VTSAFLRAALSAAVLAPALAAAQQPARATPATPVSLATTTLKPGSWTYSIRATGNGQTHEVATRTINVTSSTYANAPAWLVTEGQQTQLVVATDSLFLARADNASLHRVQRVTGQQGDGSLTMRFGKDSVSAQMEGGGQNQTLSVPRRVGAAATGTVVELALASLPLAMGWHGSVDLMVPQGPGFTTLDLTVVGEEKVTVPAGTFDTWVLVVRTSAGEQKHYVAKGGGVVRSVMTPPQLNGGTLESVLQSAAAAK